MDTKTNPNSNRQYRIFPNFKADAVLNLSLRLLSETEIKVLAWGCYFRPSLPDVPILKYITVTESYIQSAGLDEVHKAMLRKKQSYKPSWSQKDDSIIIIPADKRNKTIVLDKKQ